MSVVSGEDIIFTDDNTYGRFDFSIKAWIDNICKICVFPEAPQKLTSLFFGNLFEMRTRLW